MNSIILYTQLLINNFKINILKHILVIIQGYFLGLGNLQLAKTLIILRFLSFSSL